MAEDTRKPREPWPGYASLSEDARDEQLQKKFQAASEQGDQPYAVALAAAVANYELVLELQPETTHSEAMAVKAGDLHDDAGSWQGS